jgi:hypothetical protein
VVPNGIPRRDLSVMRKTAAERQCELVTVPLLAGILSRITSNGRAYTNGSGTVSPLTPGPSGPA